MKVTVLGAGNGGCALSYHLVQMGHEVLLYQDPNFEHLFKEVKETGQIVAVRETEGVLAELHGVAKLTRATCDVKEACEFSNILMLIVPAYAQGITFKACLPHLTQSHLFISLPGNFAFLDYAKVMHQASGKEGAVDLKEMKNLTSLYAFIETSTIPYACRLLGGNRVFIGGMKKSMEVGVLPSHKSDLVIQMIKPLFTLNLQKNTNVIETGLCNLNFILHPPITIYNAGRIESTKGDFLFYKDGLQPGVANIMQGLDNERVAIAKALNLKCESIVPSWRKWYNIPELNDMSEIPAKAKPYQFVRAPDSLNNRYITEDLVYVLIPILKYIARPLNIPTPIADAIVTSAKVLSGLTLEPARHFEGCLKDYMDI